METKLLDVVALLENIPARGLLRGQVGTVVAKLDDDFFEVEFSDDWGRTFAMVALRASRFLVLRHDLATEV